MVVTQPVKTNHALCVAYASNQAMQLAESGSSLKDMKHSGWRTGWEGQGCRKSDLSTVYDR